MSALPNSLAHLKGIVDREASLIVSDCRSAIGKGLPQITAEGRADEALKSLWAWEKYLRQLIGNAHCTGLHPIPKNELDPEPQGPFFPLLCREVMLGNISAGQPLVDALGDAIVDWVTVALLRALLQLPPLEMETRQRNRVTVAANRLPRALVSDTDDEGGTSTAEKKKPRLAPSRK